MSSRETKHLRVLIANERRRSARARRPVVAALGHEVIAREIEVEEVGAGHLPRAAGRRARRLGQSSQHALGLIEQIVQEASAR